jgi:hypothetical protein
LRRAYRLPSLNPSSVHCFAARTRECAGRREGGRFLTTDGYPGRKAVYTIARDESELFVFLVEHKWILTYRDTYHADCAVQATESLKQFGTDWHGRTG